MYCVYTIIAGDAVLCRMPVGNDTVCAWHVCCGAPTLNQCAINLKVSNIHDTILVRTQYVLVCTGLYYYTFSVPVRTGTYRYPTSSTYLRQPQVRTFIMIPVLSTYKISTVLCSTYLVRTWGK